MRAQVLSSFGAPDAFQLEDVAVPRPGPDQMLVKVAGCGVCGHDLLNRAGHFPHTRLPAVMGHEIAGEVVEAGPLVRRFKVGDRVAVIQRISCGVCRSCRNGQENICVTGPGFYGEDISGGYGEYVLASDRNAVALPDSIPLHVGAVLSCAIGTGYHALRRAGLAPIALAAKEGLALTNGTAVMCALGVLETARAERYSQTADIAGCLSLEALNGTDLAFDARIHALRPFPRQQECARYLRGLLRGSSLTREHASTNVQDAYTLRCIPQVHGAVRDAIAYARWVFEIELNAVTDNPLLFIDEASGAIDVLSGGNFHGEPLAIAMDYLAFAVSELGNIAERRLMRLTDDNSNTHVLPAFLTREGGLNSGFMILQYTAAALATENKVLAHPASVDTIPTSANVEDHVSMGVTAGLKLRDVIDNVEHILAIELMAAAQGIDFRRQELGEGARLGRGTAAAYALIRGHVPFIERDRAMAGYIEAVRQLVADGSIVATVNRAMERA